MKTLKPVIVGIFVIFPLFIGAGWVILWPRIFEFFIPLLFPGSTENLNIGGQLLFLFAWFGGFLGGAIFIAEGTASLCGNALFGRNLPEKG